MGCLFQWLRSQIVALDAMVMILYAVRPAQITVIQYATLSNFKLKSQGIVGDRTTIIMIYAVVIRDCCNSTASFRENAGDESKS
ncbi:hypothetical protein JOY44_14870 [Phormidium sp. CLA17]|uniref:hypothetical protein n=1 Tax=Leptolyngbya sp. Cla-17 TaxID=2803751 RepID=UPI001491C496|nr:hypothetical protein [Leptolyngbya sp. Cla-17]MBM0742873.1 hypothetical protein [Leptolyngbya sp. Cla-17]